MTPVNPIVNTMQGLATDIIATLGAIAPVAIGIFAVFLGWRYGKALFKTVAR